MTGPPPLAVCDRAARTYGAGPTATVALAPTDCAIAAGASIALTGPSGSGKSTLLHLLAGLDAPTAGTVSWPAIGDRGSLRPRAVAMVFQGPSLIATLTAAENVALPLVLGGADATAARERSHETLDRLGLRPLSTKLPQELSGGQAQRVAVARALTGAPRLILADEPTGQLDSSTGRAVARLLVDAARDCDAALVVSTHDRRIAGLLEQRWEIADGELSTSPVGIA